MLIRKSSASSKVVKPGSGRVGTVPSIPPDSLISLIDTPEARRLEATLSRYEKNLDLESFFIMKKDIQSLLELLSAQGSLIEEIVKILESIELKGPAAMDLDSRLGAADAKREQNRIAFDGIFNAVKSELEEMNHARLRIKQARTLAKTNYTDEEPARLENWA